MKYLLPLAVAALVIGNPMSAPAQTEVTLIAPGGIRDAIQQLIPDFERKTGHKVKATFGSGGGTKQQVVRGEAFDVPIVQPPYPEVLASGNVVVSSATPLASVAVGVAVRKGAPKPDISTADAVRRMLLAAKFISYPDASSGAAAGVSFNETLHKLGIAEQMQPKIKRAQGGAGAMALAAKGEIDIGLTFLSEMTDPGIDVVGPLPVEISTPTNLVGFVSSHAKDPAAARALLDYLSSPEAAPIYKAHGMQPGSDAESAAIKQVFADFYQSFSRHDPHATAMTFAEDGDFTNMFGIHLKGREAIEQRFIALFKGNLRDANRTDTVRSIRFYSSDVAFVDADTVITGTKMDNGSVGPVRKGLMIAVLIRKNGRWSISNFHEAEYPDRAAPVIPAGK